MDGFRLSPGITPFLADVFVAGFPLAIAVGYLLGRTRGWQTALGATALLLGAIKLVTDYGDVWDDTVAVAAVVAGLVFLGEAFRPAWIAQMPRALLAVGGVVILALGAYKVYSDFYDPFDLLVADMGIVGGLAACALARRPRTTTPVHRP